MSKLNYNGYIIQKKVNSEYRGIDGDNWYLNYCSNNPFFKNFYNDNIDKSWENSDYVDCCADESYIEKYIDESRRLEIDFRILLCATCRNFPILAKAELGQEKKVLGYDYAYSGGSYYSSILNDIIDHRINEFNRIKLNESGLFNRLEEAEKFAEVRNMMMNADTEYVFERGDFIIYEITEVII